MSNVLVISKNALLSKELSRIILEEGSRVSCVKEVKEIAGVDFGAEIIIFDSYSRFIEYEEVEKIFSLFSDAKVVCATSKDNQYLGYYKKQFNVDDFIFLDEDYDNVRSSLSELLSENGTDNFFYIKPLLTNREIEVLREIALGETSESISRKFVISKNTVDTHRNNILRKLSIANTACLIKYACKSGLI
jgi:DNA-binding NarL/FixJ family response regulator